MRNASITFWCQFCINIYFDLLSIFKRAQFSEAYGNTSQVVLVVKNLPASAGYIREVGSIPGSGRSPGGGNGNLLHYSSLENPMDRGACQATVHRVTKSQTWLKDLAHTHTRLTLCLTF